MTEPAQARNLLGDAASPYLLQHADNPVHWRPWGEAALAEARRRNRPILLSVGYAACHWCHVMAHESFEDPDTARWMNELFVNIKVDREERPDIDQLYMAALHQMGEQGGWPLTMFLTPDGEPFWGGTYFPRTARFRRPGFVDVLKAVARLYNEEPHRIARTRQALMSRLARYHAAAGQLSPRVVADVGTRLVGLFDPVNGGLAGAPKFPQAPLLDLIWRAGLVSGDERCFRAVDHTLERICRGGIYDHVGGGFARYSVDEQWLVPHFEKMLYDNAQLIGLLTTAWLRSANPMFRAHVDETFSWLVREMETDGGGLAASLDADSQGEEGRFYVWRKADIDALLGADAALFNRAFGVTEAGNFEGANVLNRLADPFPLSVAEENTLLKARGVLFRAREARPRPGRDDKVLADWNGFMIAALAHASLAFERPEFLFQAEKTYRFVADSMTRDHRVGHAWRAGRLTWPGFASDHAAMGLAALALRAATNEASYLDDAARFLDQLEIWHRAEDGTYRLAASDAGDVPLRMRSGVDEATPNPNGIAATALVCLYHLTGEHRFGERADRLLEAFAADIANNPVGHASLLGALALRSDGLQIAIIGPAHDEVRNTMVAVARRVPDPNLSLLLLVPGADLPPAHPAHGKSQVEGRATAYVCRGQSCSPPVTDANRLADLLGLSPSAI
ncbi:MAG: thioredoxin domain-containing protein [Alphaproteobacteria bacterium]|nr:MAG: thioredoxin domain-containing protein [Alphaproteobacteria bacterium]